MAIFGNEGTYLNTVTQSQMTDTVVRTWKTNNDTFEHKAKMLFNADNQFISGSQWIYNEYDGETFADYKAEGTASRKSNTSIGYQKTMSLRTFSKEIDISFEMRTDNKYRDVSQQLLDLSTFCRNRQELDFTHRLTFCTSTTYTDKNGETVDISMGDGYALAYATHTLSHSSTQYRNRVTGDPAFSQGAYEAGMLLAKTQTYSNLGEQRVLKFDTIVTGNHPATVRSVKQFLQSTADPEQNNPAVTNVYNGSMRHIVLDYLATTATGAPDSTKYRWWFLIASGRNGWQSYYHERVSPELITPTDGSNQEDAHTYDWFYSTRCRYGIVVLSGRGLIASCPSS
jgi:hypothetical protein